MTPLEARAAAAGELTHPAGPACLVVNPRSFRLSRGELTDRIRRVAIARDARIIEAGDPSAFSRALDEFLGHAPRLLAILGGDGTVQASITHLTRLAPHRPLPRLLALGGGRTNMTTADLGHHDKIVRRLRRALDEPVDRLPTTARTTLRVQQLPRLDQSGFFLAGAAVDQIIRECHRHHRSGDGLFRAGAFGTPTKLTEIAARLATGRMHLAAPELSIRADGLGELAGPTRALLAGTLAHRRGLLNPYAERGQGALRVSAATAEARHFLRHLPLMAAGYFHPALQPDTGYLSGRSDHMRIEGLTGFTLDGQEFDTDPDRPVTLSMGPEVHFLQT